MQSELEDLELRGNPSCRRLSTLFLQDNNSLAKSHDKFFHTMPNLRVLDLSRTCILALPKSLSNLKNLHALVLRSCKNLTKLPDLSRLQQLIVLDLWGTPLEHFPLGIERMKRLRRLDLSQTRLKYFPDKVVGHLVELEELLMITEYNCVWGSTEDEQRTGACVEDLVKLGKLAVLQLHFINAEALDKYINMAQVYTNVPPKFRFRVGGVQNGQYVEGNSLTIGGTAKSVLNMVSLRKLTDLNVLDVSNLGGVNSYLFKIEILGSLAKLRELCVRSCQEMVELVQQRPIGDAEGTVFCLPELTKMVLFDLPRLRSVCCGQVLNFPKLHSIEVWRCENLKLPMFHSSGREVYVRGEKSWLNKLGWDNHGNSNPQFQHRPCSDPSLTFVEAPVPPELTANWVHREDPQGGVDEEGNVEIQTNDMTNEKFDWQVWFWNWMGST